MNAPGITEFTTHTQAERQRLADLLADLPPPQWDQASLCAGWRVREVVAHITMPFRTTPRQMFAGMLRAGFSFHRYTDRDARAAAATMATHELTELLRANITHPWAPPGGGRAAALSHDVIHGLDITEPLGLPAPPADRIALVLNATTIRQARYFEVDLRRHRLIATDADASIGTGPTRVQLPVRDILLTVTGRRPMNVQPARRAR